MVAIGTRALITAGTNSGREATIIGHSGSDYVLKLDDAEVSRKPRSAFVIVTGSTAQHQAPPHTSSDPEAPPSQTSPPQAGQTAHEGQATAGGSASAHAIPVVEAVVVDAMPVEAVPMGIAVPMGTPLPSYADIASAQRGGA